MLEILFPDPFLKDKNWAYLWISRLKFYAVWFYRRPSWWVSNYIETKLQITCFYLIQSFFKKTKSGLELVFFSHFLGDFWKKNICLVIFDITWPNFIVWLPLLREILSIIPIVIVCYLGCDVINFEVNFIFIIKPFFNMTNGKRQKIKYLENEKDLPFTVCISLSVSLHNQKIRTKMQMSQERKEFLTWNKKHFSSFLKDFH